MTIRKNKILLLVSSLTTLLLLLTAALQENILQEWRRVQRAYRERLPVEAAGEFAVQLRQIVVPALGAADRCVTCHLGMAPGEPGIAGDRLFGQHPPVPHDPAEFGCTVCHGGQGRATTSDAAHGTVAHWPEPMVPRSLAYAGCGACHTQLAVPGRETLTRGLVVFERNDCLACHKLDGRGGTLRPGAAGGMEGPDLSRVGATGFDASWYGTHLGRLREGADPAWQASFGEVPTEDLAVLDAWLRTRVGAPGLVEAKALFHANGCRGCHKVGSLGGDDGPDLSRVGLKDPGQLDFTHVSEARTLAAWQAAHLRTPSAVVPGSNMPRLGLLEDEIETLVFYLLSLRAGPAADVYRPTDTILAERFGHREVATDGASLYQTFCSACHGEHGEGMRYPGMAAFPAVASVDFLALAPDSFLIRTIRDGRPGRRMPAWGLAGGGLTEGEIATLAAHLRDLGGGVQPETDPRPPRWARGDPKDGRRLYSEHCARCHGPEGNGGEGTALHNPVLLESATDTYLFETIRRGRGGTSMPGFARPTAVSAALDTTEVEAIVSFLRTWEGETP